MKPFHTPPRIPGIRAVHSPGPTHIPDEVLAAMHQQPMDLADPRVAELVEDVEQGLRWLCGASDDTHVVLYSSNGHGVWEATIENLLPIGSKVLVPGTGHFSDGWALQANSTGREAIRTRWREGLPIDTDEVEQVLRDDALDEIKAVFFVHTDTASSVTSSIAAIRRAIDEAGHPALLVVDAVASVGAAPLHMADERIDVVVGASQKGLMGPPGMGFVLVNPRASEAARANPAPRFYWDWKIRAGEHSYSKFCGTAPLQPLMGMRQGLLMLQQEGLDALFARHRRLAHAVHAAVQGWAEGGQLNFFCREVAARSVSVTAVRTAEGLNPEQIRTVARERFQVAMAGGLGPLAGKVFRIGHLGDLNEAMVLGALGGIEAALLHMKIDIGPGTRRAIEFLAA